MFYIPPWLLALLIVCGIVIVGAVVLVHVKRKKGDNGSKGEKPARDKRPIKGKNGKTVKQVKIPNLNIKNAYKFLIGNDKGREYIWTKGRITSLDKRLKMVGPFSGAEGIYVEAQIVEIYRTRTDGTNSPWVEEARLVKKVVQSNPLALLDKAENGKDAIYVYLDHNELDVDTNKQFFKRELIKDVLSQKCGCTFKKTPTYETRAFDFIELVLREDQKVKVIGDIMLVDDKLTIVKPIEADRKGVIEGIQVAESKPKS